MIWFLCSGSLNIDSSKRDAKDLFRVLASRREDLTGAEEIRLAGCRVYRASRKGSRRIFGYSRSLLDTILHFCYNNTLIRIKNDHFLNMAPTGKQFYEGCTGFW